jgi:hypothetical protein
MASFLTSNQDPKHCSTDTDLIQKHTGIELYATILVPAESQKSGSGSVLGIRIPDLDPGARKLRNFNGKMHFLVIFLKNFTTKKV